MKEDIRRIKKVIKDKLGVNLFNYMKILLIIIDGLGDRPIPELGNKTPLEAAKTPNLDSLAKKGSCGLVDTFFTPKQEYPRSDTAHLALLGYDPKKDYLGRGPYEVAGIGMDLKKGDVALRANFGTVDEELKVLDRRAGRIKKTQDLVKALKGIEIKGVKFLIKKSYGHRAGLIMRSEKKLSSKITNGDPHRVGVKVNKVKGEVHSKETRFTAKVLNEFLEKAHLILKKHPLNEKRKSQGLLPANYLLVRGAGEIRKVTPFNEKYGMKAACIAGGSLYRGIGKLLGMDLVKVEGDTGLPDTNLRGKFGRAVKAIKNYDFVFVHVKASDNLAEDGNFKGKKEFIERIDSNLKQVLELKNTLVVITADHSTCCALKRHCTEPVPLLIFGKEEDKVDQFSEKECKKGKLGLIKQTNLMKTILQFKD